VSSAYFRILLVSPIGRRSAAVTTHCWSYRRALDDTSKDVNKTKKIISDTIAYKSAV